MRMKWFLLVLSVLASSLGLCAEDNLWFIEQDFVKFGKKDAYEKYKKEMLSNRIGTFSTFAVQADDSLQYIYLVPVKDYCGLGDFLQKRSDYEQSLHSESKAPYFSTLNFTIGSLQRYLPDCSYVPKGKEALTAYRNIYFYLFSIAPGNEEVLEARLQKIAEEQEQNSGVCFRSWKIVIGSNVPKYLVTVFATGEKQVQKRAEELEVIDLTMKNIVLTQKQGSAILRKDLSTMKGKNGG